MSTEKTRKTEAPLTVLLPVCLAVNDGENKVEAGVLETIHKHAPLLPALVHQGSVEPSTAISQGNSRIRPCVKTCCSTLGRFVRMLLAIPRSDLAAGS